MKRLLAGVLALGLGACGLEEALEEAALEIARDQAIRNVVKEVAQKASAEVQTQASSPSAAPAFSTAEFEDDFPDLPGGDGGPSLELGEPMSQEELDELCAGAEDAAACKETFADATSMEMDATVALDSGGSMSMKGTFAMTMTGGTTAMIVNVKVTYADMKVEVDGKTFTASGSEEFKGEMKIEMPEIDPENPQEVNQNDINIHAKFQSKGEVTVDGQKSTYEITTEMLSDGSLRISGNIDGETFSETVTVPQTQTPPPGDNTLP